MAQVAQILGEGGEGRQCGDAGVPPRVAGQRPPQRRGRLLGGPPRHPQQEARAFWAAPVAPLLGGAPARPREIHLRAHHGSPPLHDRQVRWRRQREGGPGGSNGRGRPGPQRSRGARREALHRLRVVATCCCLHIVQVD